MGIFGDRLSRNQYDEELSIWVEEASLGSEIFLRHNKQRYAVKIPANLRRAVTLRLKGLGKTRGGRTGDLYLHVWLNKGIDARRCLWLSADEARRGAVKQLRTGKEIVAVTIPPGSQPEQILRLKGLGGETPFDARAPALRLKKRGNLLVKLEVYPDQVSPSYGSLDSLSDDSLALEGWVYLKYDEVIRKLGRSSLPARPLPAGVVADRFNTQGWRGVAALLREHFGLKHTPVKLAISKTITAPGMCTWRAVTYTQTGADGQPVVVRTERDYRIEIQVPYLSSPFAVAAILAHELCHVVYAEKLAPPPAEADPQFRQSTLEEERTVDLLVLLFKMGEFQLRVAKGERVILGYFNYELFERIQALVAKKLRAG